jgi:hypothetical protein
LSQGPAAEKKRRIASSQVLEISHKRVRHVSREYKPPRTDEELAQRFKEVWLLPRI